MIKIREVPKGKLKNKLRIIVERVSGETNCSIRLNNTILSGESSE